VDLNKQTALLESENRKTFPYQVSAAKRDGKVPGYVIADFSPSLHYSCVLVCFNINISCYN